MHANEQAESPKGGGEAGVAFVSFTHAEAGARPVLQILGLKLGSDLFPAHAIVDVRLYAVNHAPLILTVEKVFVNLAWQHPAFHQRSRA